MKNSVFYVKNSDNTSRDELINMLSNNKAVQYFLIAYTLDGKITGFIRFYKDERSKILDMDLNLELVSWKNIRLWAANIDCSSIYEKGKRPKLIYAKSVNCYLKI